MSSRPGRRLRITPNGRGYVFLPFAAEDVPCTQRIEVVAPDGSTCEVRDYLIAAGTCTTKDLELGADGTVIQPLPDAMEQKEEVAIGTAQTCTWRWWPAAVK